MTARFAGSRSLDERRRRRLAQESLEDEVSVRRPPASRRIDGSHPTPPPIVTAPRGRVESLIPRAWWRLALLVFMGLACWSGMLWAGLSDWPRRWGLDEIVSLDSGRLPKFFSIVCHVLSAELCLVIFWHRSQSRKDFMGRYRVWGWASVFLGLICICAATGLHWPLAEALQQRWPLDCFRPVTMYWLVPTAVGGLALHQLLLRDMRHAQWSTICWRLTFFLGLAAGSLHLGVERTIPTEWRVLATAATLSFWQVSLTASLLLHARFVVHVTNEAAPRGINRRTRATRWAVRSLLAWMSRQRTTTTSGAPAPEGGPSRDTTGSPRPESERRQKRRVLGTQVRLDAQGETGAPHVEMAAAARADQSARAAHVKPAETAEEDQSRLSRKERRRLKKQQRQRIRDNEG